MTSSDKSGHDHMWLGACHSPTLFLLHRPLSAQSFSEAEAAMLYGMRPSWNRLMYFMLYKSVCVLLKIKFHAFYAWEIIFYFGIHILQVLGTKQACWIEMFVLFVMVYWSSINPEHWVFSPVRLWFNKSVPLQALSGPEGFRKLRFPDFMTTAQGGGKVVSLTHRPHLPPGNSPGTHFC